jgi:hypothetical protein
MQVRTLSYRRLYRDQKNKPSLDSKLHFTDVQRVSVIVKRISRYNMTPFPKIQKSNALQN